MNIAKFFKKETPVFKKHEWRLKKAWVKDNEIWYVPVDLAIIDIRKLEISIDFKLLATVSKPYVEAKFLL